jgi:hypothetical protein
MNPVTFLLRELGLALVVVVFAPGNKVPSPTDTVLDLAGMQGRASSPCAYLRVREEKLVLFASVVFAQQSFG